MKKRFLTVVASMLLLLTAGWFAFGRWRATADQSQVVETVPLGGQSNVLPVAHRGDAKSPARTASRNEPSADRDGRDGSVPADVLISAANADVFAELTKDGQSALDGAAQTRGGIRRVWGRLLGGNNSRPLSEPAVSGRGGAVVPADIARIEEGATEYPDLLKDHKIPFATTSDDIYQAASMYACALFLAKVAGDDLPFMFSARAHATPPTTEDEMAYFAINAAIIQMASSSAMRYPTIESLMEFTAAENPIYRLLALEAGSIALPDGTGQRPAGDGPEKAAVDHARMKLYQKFQTEDDPLIATKLINYLSLSSVAEAQELLHAVRDRQKAAGRDDVASIADAALAALTRTKK